MILLRRITDGYTTLSEVYRYILEPSQIEQNISRLTAVLKEPPEVIIVSAHDYHQHCAQRPWTLWFAENAAEFAHPYDADLDSHLAAKNVPFRVAKSNSNVWLTRRHQLQAIDRWYKHG